jgi:cytochrome P450
MDIGSRAYPFARKCPFAEPEEFPWIRANAPVTRVRPPGTDGAFLIAGYDDVRAALVDPRLRRTPERADDVAGLDTGFQADRDSPIFSFGAAISEPPGHTRWRRVVNRAFTARQAESMRPAIAAHADGLLEAMEREGPGCDLMGAYAYQLPIRVISDLLGIPVDDRPQFTAMARGLTRRESAASMAELGQSLRDIGRYAARLIAAKRRAPGPDLLSTLIDSSLTSEELIATVVLLLMAGYESTAVQIGNAVFALLREPAHLARIAAEPALIAGAVDELLRYAQMGTGFAVAKFAAEDVEYGGVTIPAGAMVFVSLASANHDESVFGPDSADLDPERSGADRHLAYGYGPHYCLGAAIATVLLQEGIGRLLSRFPKLAYDGDLGGVELASNLFTYYPRTLPVVW